MKRLFVLLGLCLWITTSHAGVNEGGVLVVHHDPELVFSASCDSLIVPADCSQLNTTAAADGSPQLWFVLAAFADSIPDRFNTVTFGLGNYNDTDLVIGDWGSCEIIGSPLEIPSDGWPAPNTGTSVSWAPNCGGDGLFPIYWFVTYAYGPGTIPLGDYYPDQSGAFVSCGSPPEEDAISDYGTMGFGVAGQNSCPATLGGGEGQGGDEDLGGGDRVPAESLVVAPTAIDPGLGCWTFVTYGWDEPQVHRLQLVLEESVYEPAFEERTTDYSRLWTFEFSPRDTVGSASITVSRATSGSSEMPLSVKRGTRIPKENTVEGRVSIRTEPDVMGYEPGVRERTLAELAVADQQLLRHLRTLGVTAVRKMSFLEGDTPAVRQGNQGPYLPDPRRFRRYHIILASEHCEEAIAEILRALAVVRDASVAVPLRDFETCDDHIYDSYYGNQWNLHSEEDGEVSKYGTQANTAWCTTRGGGNYIAIIDKPIARHINELEDQVGAGEFGDLCEEDIEERHHGTSMACIAVARANNQGEDSEMVGVAYEARVFEINVPCVSTFSDATDALSRAATYLEGEYGDVVSISRGTFAPIPEQLLEEQLAALHELVVYEEVPVFAAGPKVLDIDTEIVRVVYPGFWDQNNEEDDYVLSVGGSSKAGCAGNPEADIFANILAPNHDIYTCLNEGDVIKYLGIRRTPSAAVPQVAASAAIVQDFIKQLQVFAYDPYALYDLLVGCGTPTADFCIVENVIVNPARAMYILTPIDPVANFTATTGPGDREMTLSWDVLASPDFDIWSFRLLDATSCWGPFDLVEEVPLQR